MKQRNRDRNIPKIEQLNIPTLHDLSIIIDNLDMACQEGKYLKILSIASNFSTAYFPILIKQQELLGFIRTQKGLNNQIRMIQYLHDAFLDYEDSTAKFMGLYFAIATLYIIMQELAEIIDERRSLRRYSSEYYIDLHHHIIQLLSLRPFLESKVVEEA